MALIRQLFYKKTIGHNTKATGLNRCLTAVDLTVLGVGGIIGAGIFVLTGIAAAVHAGPAIILSYLLAGLACSFTALAYAELAASVGGCGSAYGYAYAGLGEIVAWMVGWDLLLAYGMNGATVAMGWSGYIQGAFQAMGIHLPKTLLQDPFHGGIINLPAVFIIFILASILSIGMKESARFNKLIVLIKVVIIVLFIGVGSYYFDLHNWQPFMPFGVKGVIKGAGLIFFAYIGFDAVSTAAEEAVNPQRDLPIGIIASLIISTVIYIIIAAVMTGMMYYPALNVSSPAALVMIHVGHPYIAEIVALGAVIGLTSVILVMFYGATRVFLAMARDGLLPQKLIKISPKSQTPCRLIWLVGCAMAIVAGFFPIDEIAVLVNICTIAAFIVVCVGVIVLRYTKPNMPRPFKTPGSPYVPALGILLCLFLLIDLPAGTWTWISFYVWTAIGLLVYFSYSRIHSVLRYEKKLLQ